MQDTKIYASIIDEATEKMVRNLEESEAYKGCPIRIMPDCHAGIGCTVGTVIYVRDRIVPNTVGVDIGCGMLVARLGKEEVDLQRLDEVINEKVPSGFNIHETASSRFDMLDGLFCREVIDSDMASRSIGTLGGGNHFIELDEDSVGRKYLVIHSGSRNLGKRVCEYWQKKAVEHCRKGAYNERELVERLKAEGRQREIADAIKEAKANAPKIDKDMAYLEGEDANRYLHDMMICQHYAQENRLEIVYTICKAMDFRISHQFTTLHNYIDHRLNILRKGAVSATKDEELIIPMNMRDGSLLCVGKGNLDWLYSAPHGAGRLMSRRQARETLSMQEFERSMEGIYSTSVCPETIDEAPMVYKPMDEIVKCIKPTVQVLDVLKPLYNFKAKTQGVVVENKGKEG